MKQEQEESQEEKCPCYNAMSPIQMSVQVPIVLIFSSVVFSLEKSLNQRKAHKKPCDSLPHFMISVCPCTCLTKVKKNEHILIFPFIYGSIGPVHRIGQSLQWGKKVSNRNKVIFQ